MRLLDPPNFVNTSPLSPGGSVDQHMQNVMFWVFWLSVVVGVLVSGLLLFSFFRFRRRSDEDMPTQFHGNTKLELTWTMIPFVILITLFVVTMANMGYIQTSDDAVASSGKPAIHVTVIGQQFTWTFDYVSAGIAGHQKGGTDIQTVTDLYIPPDTPIDLAVVSTDPHGSDSEDVTCASSPKVPTGADAAHTQAARDLQSKMAAVQSDPNLTADQKQFEVLAQGIKMQGCGVNHSLYVPSLAGQVNAIPGRVNNIWLDGHYTGPSPGAQNKETIYYGQCTELCGLNHAGMLLEVHVLPDQKAYDAWLTGAAS